MALKLCPSLSGDHADKMRRVLLSGLAAASAKELVKGIAYGPIPLKVQGGVPNDDFMASQAKALWADNGRGDIAIMQSLGANTVRLYGNDPQEDHNDFLDAIESHSMKAIPGMSDYPYTQSYPGGNCIDTHYNCFDQLKAEYLGDLQGGFLRAPDAQGNREYRNSISHFIVVNEPDLKLGNSPADWNKGILSAIDGMLEAEKEMNVTGFKPNLTATFSYGVCAACGPQFSRVPALGQMVALRAAFQDPSTVGYTPVNDLAEFYRTRFVNSFNTANPYTDITLEIQHYESLMNDIPVFMGEYHSTYKNQMGDVPNMLALAQDESSLLLGFNFFQFQVSYWKGGSEMLFGMFGLGNYSFSEISFYGRLYNVSCLVPVMDPHSNNTNYIYEAVQQAYQGAGLDTNSLCSPAANKVFLTEDGYEAVLAMRSTAQMATFVTRLVAHLGGVIIDGNGLNTFADKYSDESHTPVGGFASMMSDLGGKPPFAYWDPSAACVASRESDSGTIGAVFGYACGQLATTSVGNMSTFNCSTDVPSFCNSSIHIQADYVLSLYYARFGQNPLENCYQPGQFGGAMVYAAASQYHSEDPNCVITNDPNTTAMTQEGYSYIVSLEDSTKVEIFIFRVVTEDGEQVADMAPVQQLASNPPATLKQLKAIVSDATWVCGGRSGRTCPPAPPTAPPGPTEGPTSTSRGPGPGPGPGPAPSPPGTPGNNNMLYIGIGAAAVVMLAGAIAACLLLRKPAVHAAAAREPFMSEPGGQGVSLARSPRTAAQV